ncbi:rRNA-processing protein UTP23 homolog [Salvia splendens]|uniref:rRNA-processing protein UTP23 homolog n=1 Tax=Salvia splendens TaxID=180675 RepID=UPI001C279A17|nr:rRNA-processing protein UTP23 homolog [Salvia splendens]
MRFTKQKRHRKAVRFFTSCFGFREPFKVLCDGTFVHHLIANLIAPADTALTNILGAPVKIFTTRCVVAELKSLGSSYSDSVDAARSLMVARCDHEKRKSAIACITEVIGEKNTEHFFVATQDAELRKKFQQIPGVPLVYALRNALFLERPSAFQQESAKAAEEERSRMTELELKMLKLKKKKVANDEGRNSSETEEEQILETLIPRTDVKMTRIDKADKAQFKRKRAKGPNPLSCKKKKKQGNTDTASQKMRSQVRSQEGDGDNSARNRKRKRSRKNKTSTEL